MLSLAFLLVLALMWFFIVGSRYYRMAVLLCVKHLQLFLV